MAQQAAVKKPKTSLFSYEGVDKQGRKVKGEVEGTNVAAVNVALRRQGINPQRVARRRGELFKFRLRPRTLRYLPASWPR